MKVYELRGAITYPATVTVEAESKDEARHKAADGDFIVQNEAVQEKRLFCATNDIRQA